jgi:hypothetical protein
MLLYVLAASVMGGDLVNSHEVAFGDGLAPKNFHCRPQISQFGGTLAHSF